MQSVFSFIRLKAVVGVLAMVLCLGSAAQRAQADWINLSGAETSPNIAEITVLDDRVRIALEIYVEDIDKILELVPEDWLKEYAGNFPSREERLSRFSEDKFQVLANGTDRLTAELRLSEPRLRKDRASPFAGMINPITRQRTPEAPADKRVLYVELDYPFEDKPSSITIIPPQDADGRSLLATGFIAYHKAVPVIDFRYLTAAATLQLDWDDPWYSAFDNPNLKRHHRWPMLTYLYMEPREVRHEAVVRLRDLGEWLELDLDTDEAITPERQSEIREAANRFFALKNPVEIDGTPVQPESVRSAFLDLSLTGVQVIDDDRSLDPTTAVLGVILSYPVMHLPKEVTARWDLFTERVDRVPATSVDPAGPFPSEVGREDPVHTWTNHLLKYEEPVVASVPVGPERQLAIPVLSAALLIVAIGFAILAVRKRGTPRMTLAGLALVSVIGAAAASGHATVQLTNPFAGTADEAEATPAVEAILANSNAAFQEVLKPRLEERLTIFVDEASSSDVAAELERAINIKLAGGNTARVAKVEDVTLSEIFPLEGRKGFSTLAEWTAQATGQHWGHTHIRDIAYRARLDLVEDKGEWRLAGLTVLEAEIRQ